GVALCAVGLAFKCRSARMVTRSTGGLRRLRRLVHGGFPVQGRLCILRPLCRMTCLAFVLFPLGMRRVIVREIAVLGIEYMFGWRFLARGTNRSKRDNVKKQNVG